MRTPGSGPGGEREGKWEVPSFFLGDSSGGHFPQPSASVSPMVPPHLGPGLGAHVSHPEQMSPPEGPSREKSNA